MKECLSNYSPLKIVGPLLLAGLFIRLKSTEKRKGEKDKKKDLTISS